MEFLSNNMAHIASCMQKQHGSRECEAEGHEVIYRSCHVADARVTRGKFGQIQAVCLQ